MSDNQLQPLDGAALRKLLAGRTLKTEVIDVPDVGRVTVRELTATERLDVGMLILDESNKPSMQRMPEMLRRAALYGLDMERGDEHLLEKGGGLVELAGQTVLLLSNMAPGQQAALKNG
jgi:hypothetical protein